MDNIETSAEGDFERRASIRRPANFATIRNMFERAQSSDGPTPMFTRAINWIFGFGGAAEDSKDTEEVVATSPSDHRTPTPSSEIVKSKVKFFEAIANNTAIGGEEKDDKDEDETLGELLEPREVTLRSKTSHSLSSSSFSSYRSSSTSTSTVDSSYDTGRENFNSLDREDRKHRAAQVSRDDSITRHFDRFYSRISEASDNHVDEREAATNSALEPRALSELDSKVSPSSCGDHLHHQSACVHQKASTHASSCSAGVVTVNIYNHTANVNTHRHRTTNGGHRLRKRLLRPKKSAQPTNITGKHAAASVVDVRLKMEQQLASSMLFGGFHSRQEENQRVHDYQLHLFTDQLASVIELISRYDRENRCNEDKHKSMSDVDKIQSISGNGGGDKPKSQSKRLLLRGHSWRVSRRRPERKQQHSPLVRTISVADYIEQNRDTIKQIGSPWKNFVQNSSSAASPGHPMLDKMKSLHEKEVQVYEAMFEVIYSEYAYLQRLKSIIEYPKEKEAELACLSAYDRRTLFSNIEEIYQLNSKLYEHLLIMFQRDMLMGDLFRILVRNFEHFDPYIRFIRGQNERNRLLADYELQSLLISPTKRIGHYPLLLETIEKQIRSALRAIDDTDNEVAKAELRDKLKQIETCLEVARGFANKCNEALEAQTNLQELISFKTKLIGDISHLVETGRRIHQHVDVRGKKFTSQLLNDANLKVHYRLFLLTDMLLIVKHKTKRDNYSLVSHAKLVNIHYQHGVRQSNFFDWAEELNRQSMANFGPNTSIITLNEAGGKDESSTGLVKFIVTYNSKEDADKFVAEFNQLQKLAKAEQEKKKEKEKEQQNNNNRHSVISISPHLFE